jgi:hypothetical protein
MPVTKVTINGIPFSLSDTLKRDLSDALLLEVRRFAQIAVTYVDEDPLTGSTIDRSHIREAAIFDGLMSQLMHGALWGYSTAEAEARWADALHLAR